MYETWDSQLLFSRFTPTLQRDVEGRSRKRAPPNNFEGQVADAAGISHRHGPNKFPLHHHLPPTHVHNSTAYPPAYATSSKVSTTVAGSRLCPSRHIFAHHALRCACETALVDSVRLTHYLLDSLFQPQTLVSYTKRSLETWYVSLWPIA